MYTVCQEQKPAWVFGVSIRRSLQNEMHVPSCVAHFAVGHLIASVYLSAGGHYANVSSETNRYERTGERSTFMPHYYSSKGHASVGQEMNRTFCHFLLSATGNKSRARFDCSQTSSLFARRATPTRMHKLVEMFATLKREIVDGKRSVQQP